MCKDQGRARDGPAFFVSVKNYLIDELNISLIWITRSDFSDRGVIRNNFVLFGGREDISLLIHR